MKFSGTIAVCFGIYIYLCPCQMFAIVVFSGTMVSGQTAYVSVG